MNANCTKPRFGKRDLLGQLLQWGLGAWLVLLCHVSYGQTPATQPSYWQQRLFFIPYQANTDSRLLNPISKVQLLVSRTGANDWATLQEAEPNVQGFSYHAPEDGEYWFALRHLDRRGQPWPSAEVTPQMRIVVDTVDPQLSLAGSLGPAGEVIVRYEASDANLQTGSLRIEARGATGNWTALRLPPADIAQPDRLVGRATWQPPASVTQIELRGAIADRAGRKAEANTSVEPSNPELHGPDLGDPLEARAIVNPFMSTAQLPSQDWPTSNRLPPRPQRSVLGESSVPPIKNPYTLGSQQSATPSRLIGDRSAGTADTSQDANAESQTLKITPLDSDGAPSLLETTPWPSPNSNTQSQPATSQWAPPVAESQPGTKVVNSQTFEIEYDLESVGPWGVSKVELWGTRDGGQTWQSFGVDPDNRSPFRVTVPAAGSYGFRIVVDGANSAGSPPPQAGDAPELLIAVDLQPPTVQLQGAELGSGNLADHLLVRWTADDTNLEPRPIALFYSSYPNGPWSTIAAGLQNTGSYTWRIERHVPGRFYLRLEARDIAGNLATFVTPNPIELARPQPKGQLRGVRPVN